MARTTIDFGIDLGTTNSTVGLFNNGEVEIIKNNESEELTASAVWMDASNALVVGRAAKEKVEFDPGNAFAEFKLQMGTNDEKVFARNNRRVKPEELSAEVLKSLKADVQQSLNEEITGAVITIPAAFSAPASHATKRAAQLAGITSSPLLQEPVAAATAYGFEKQSGKVFWLVYDLGGGTFDAAVMQVRNGVISVEGHGGNEHLGGKQIDWEIVEKLLIPALVKEHSLPDFRRGNKQWARPLAKLKLEAEKAKIRLARNRSAEISIEFNHEGRVIDFSYTLQRGEVETLAEPIILSSINICQKVLAETGLQVGNLEKVILVGGPTLMPYLRERLLDPLSGLGRPLEFRVDPMTVVARGAAIFAGMQVNENPISVPVSAGQYAVRLDYKPIGVDPDFHVGGEVAAQTGQNLAGFTIEFINENARTPFQTGKIQLTPDGKFLAQIWAETGKPNHFRIELRDPLGSLCAVTPDRLSYNFGAVPDSATLIHSIGIVLANNETCVFFEKGTPLPVRKRFVQKLAHRVIRMQTDDIIRIPVIEGEHKKADRNLLIGCLEIPAINLKRDLPVDAEIEISISIDQSRLMQIEAYITMLQEPFRAELRMEKTTPKPAELEQEIEFEKKRLAEVGKKVFTTDDTKARQILDRIEAEQMVKVLENTLDAAQVDRDAADESHNQLLSLRATLDELEEVLAIPSLQLDAREVIEWTRELIEDYGTPVDQRKFEQDYRELKMAMEARVIDPAELNRKIEQMVSLQLQVSMSRYEWWVDMLVGMKEQKSSLTNQELAERLFAEAQQAIVKGNAELLKSICRQLMQLLPVQQQLNVGRYRSSVKRSS